MARKPDRKREQKRPFAQRLRIWTSRHVQNCVGALGRLWRQPFSNGMTIIVIGIALALPAALHLMVKNGSALGGRWESVVDISVYLKQGVSEQDAMRIADSILQKQEVTEVELIPADQALENFRRASGFGAALDALSDNPLPHAIVVRPDPEYASPEAVIDLGTALQEIPEADIVQQDTEWVERFHAILDVVRRGVLVAAVLLALAVLIIVGNTIRLDIENRREEIEVTKLVGATDGFIRRPFLYSGFWYGLSGALVAVLLVLASLWLLAGPVGRLAGFYGSDFELEGLGPRAYAVLLVGGAFLGWFGSWVAAARHLRRIEPT
ncbi:MAG: permease-like cell division protein FtsX [Gammaproteobacteria bacterium]